MWMGLKQIVIFSCLKQLEEATLFTEILVLQNTQLRKCPIKEIDILRIETKAYIDTSF